MWKYTALLSLLLFGGVQVLPFIPTHSNCEAACCVTEVSCCDSEVKTGCDMAMTSCSVSLFMPLISAPLIKVDSNFQMDLDDCLPQVHEVLLSDQHIEVAQDISYSHGSPPSLTPLLI